MLLADRAKCCAVAIVLAIMVLPAPARAAPFPDELRRACPAKRLDWLNPGILIEGIDDFLEGLAPSRRSQIEAMAKPNLDKCEAGAGCYNAAYIVAARQAGLLPELLRTVCKLPIGAPLTLRAVRLEPQSWPVNIDAALM